MKKNFIDIRHLINNYIKKKNAFLDVKFLSKEKTVNKKIKLISDLINKNIRNKQSIKFWHTLLFFWFNRTIYDIYKCYFLFEKIFKKNKNYLIYEINPEEFTHSESSCVIDTEKFIIFLASEYIKIKKINFKIKKKYILTPVQKSYNNIAKLNLYPKSIIKKIHFFISKFFFRFYSPKIILDDLFISYIDMIKINLGLRQLPLQWSIKFKKFENKYKLEKRTLLIKKLKRNNFFDNYLNIILIKVLPIGYFENFDNIYEYIIKTYPMRYHKYLSGSLSSIPEKKIFMQIMKKKGTKIFVSQHGGTYAYFKKSISVKSEGNFFNKILTWGWKNSKNEKIFFNLNFINYPKKHNLNKENNKILICSNLRTNYFILISKQPKSPSICDENIKNISNFCFFLKKNFKSEISIRYLKKHKNSGFSFKENQLPNFVKFDHAEKVLRNVLPKFKIVIHNGLYSNAFFETLYLNKPTLVLVNPKDIIEYNQSFKQHLKNLIDIGIVHTNNNSLKKFFFKNYSKIDEWWESEKVKKTLENFKDNYLRSSNSLIKDLNQFAIS